MSTDRYRTSRSAYSSRSYGSMRHMPAPPSPPAPSRRGYLAAPLSTTSITLDQRFSSLKRARSVSPERPPSPLEEDRLGPGSAKNQRYLAGLARRADIAAAVGDTDVSQVSHSAGAEDAAVIHVDKLARARRIAAARAARNSKSRGDVHSRLGVRRGSGPGARGPPRHFVQTVRRGQGQRGGRERSMPARNVSKLTAEALDSQLDEYMESAKKV